MRKMLSVLAVTGVASATILAGGSIAAATSAEEPEREKVEVTWIMPEGASDTSPQWPQAHSPSGEIPCGRWAQIDTYYADEAERFTEDGILEKGEDRKTDTQAGALEWRFAQGAECVEPTAVTPVAPTVVQAADCDTDGYVTIPQTKGVRYEFYAVPGENQSGKRYEGPVAETVKVIVEEGYVLAEGAQTEFFFDVKSFEGECATLTQVVAPTIIEETKCDTNSTVTIPATTGVVFAMGGETVQPGTLKAPLDGTLTAHPAEGYALADDATTEWAIDLAAAKPCAQAAPVKTPTTSDPSLPELAYTGASPELMGAGAALMLALGGGLTLAGRALRWGRRG